MIDTLLMNALLAGCGLALLTGPLGCFVAWMRLAYFGDAIAHGALLGVVFGLFMEINMTAGIALAALAQALLLAWLTRRRELAGDTLIGVLSHGALALALVLLAWMGRSVDVQAYLFGDLLAIAQEDIALLFGFAAVSGGLLAWNWQGLMLMVLNADMAAVEGVNVFRLRLLLMLLVALAVALSIKVVGVLLITSMLVLPAAAARPLSRTPEGMAVLACLCGLLAVAGGVLLSFQTDAPTGPSIILAALAVFAASVLTGRRFSR